MGYFWSTYEVKFIHSEKATKFCEIFLFHLTVCTVVKSKVKISQNFVSFSEYMNFRRSYQKAALCSASTRWWWPGHSNLE